MTFESPIPEDMEVLVEKLEGRGHRAEGRGQRAEGTTLNYLLHRTNCEKFTEKDNIEHRTSNIE
jgi:hypothetical protein